MRRRALGLALSAVIVGTLPAWAAPARVDTQVYMAPGGASTSTFSAYATSSQRPVADNVGLVRSLSRAGEKTVRIRVQDGNGSPVAARVEGYRNGSGFRLVTCNASQLPPLRLAGLTELRVLPLAGLCTNGTSTSLSAPTTGEVLFSYTR